MSTFRLVLTSSAGLFYDGECESMILPTEDGEYGILANHESMVIGVCVGVAKYKIDGVWYPIVVGRGYARTFDNSVYLVVDSIERPEDVDENRAREAKKRAEERMRVRKSRQEYYRGQLAMTRAMARLKVKEQKYN